MRHHEYERRVIEAPEERARERPQPIHDVLALQRSAGNQAVAAMLAREPETQQAGHVTLTNIGKIPVHSFWRSSAPGRGDRDAATELCFVSKIGAHSTKLTQAMSSGTPVDGDIDVKALKVKITNAFVSHYQVAGEGDESWCLMPSSAHVDDGSGEGGRGGSESPDWGRERQPG
jgi:hypothetical protein